MHPEEKRMPHSLGTFWARLNLGWLLWSLLGIGMFTSAPASAAQRIVGQSGVTCPNAQYTTIGAAVNASSPYDVIEICPALYPEQVIITKPLTLKGLNVGGVNRVLIQPTSFTPISNPGFDAVIAVLNTHDVTIENLAIDASQNDVTACTPGLAAVHFHDASGTVQYNAIFGATLAAPLGCASGLPFGNGFGVQADADQAGSFHVTIEYNSIHDYTANGVLIENNGVTATVLQNDITGIGPAGGVFQFGVFFANGAAGLIQGNVITEGNCGALSIADCIGVRSEGVTLRAIGNGTVVDHNIISKAQSGIFINGASHLRVTNNEIGNIDALSGMDIQGTATGAFTDSVIDSNIIFNVGPIDADASNNEEGCGINEYSGTGVSGNSITNTNVNDAYCGIAAVAADSVGSSVIHNTLYPQLNSDAYPNVFPPPTEP
jgi:hypothetical protein